MSLLSEEIRSYVLRAPYDLYRLSRWKIQIRDHRIHSIDFGYVSFKESYGLRGSDSENNEAFYEQNRHFFTNILEPLMDKHLFFTLEASLDAEGNLVFDDHIFRGRFEFKASECFKTQVRFILENLPEIFHKDCVLTFTSVNHRSRSLSYQTKLKNLLQENKPLPYEVRENNRHHLEHLHNIADLRRYFETLLLIDEQREIATIDVKLVLHNSDLKRRGAV
jgi:hypothetical protein